MQRIAQWAWVLWRERREDLPILVAALLEDLNRKHSTKVTDLVPAALDRFHAYPWPGNIRELRNVLERTVILAGDRTIQAAHLPPALGGAPMPLSTPARDGNELRVPVGHTIEQAERALIEPTPAHTKENKTRGAEILRHQPENGFQ